MPAVASSTASSPVYVFLLANVALFLCFGLYYWFRLRSSGPPSAISKRLIPNTKSRTPAAPVAPPPPPSDVPDVVEKRIKPMYIPREVGHRTGQKRVFVTNKGLRAYEVNEHGWPLPPVTAVAAGP